MELWDRRDVGRGLTRYVYLRDGWQLGHVTCKDGDHDSLYREMVVSMDSHYRPGSPGWDWAPPEIKTPGTTRIPGVQPQTEGPKL